MPRAFVGLGSNLGDRKGNLRRAIDALGSLPGTVVVRESHFRETEPVGFQDQPRFLNGAVELETSLEAPELLEALLDIERRLGRRRAGVPKGARGRSTSTCSSTTTCRSPSPASSFRIPGSPSAA